MTLPIPQPSLIENPFVLAIMMLVASLVGAILSKVIERLLDRREKVADKDEILAGRLATLEAVVAHVSADQAAHAQQSRDLNDLKIAVAELRTGMRAIGNQNRAIWKKLTAAAA